MSEARELYLLTAQAGLRIGELAAEIIKAMSRGERKAATEMAGELMRIAHFLSHAHWFAADGNRAAAKKLAKNMVENGRKS